MSKSPTKAADFLKAMQAGEGDEPPAMQNLSKRQTTEKKEKQKKKETMMQNKHVIG